MISRCRGSSSSNHAQRPLLQRLGQQRVVRVGERPPGEVPGLVPSEVRLVEQDPHQLGHGQAGVGVVELDGDLVRAARSSRRCSGGSAARDRPASRRPGNTPARSAAPAPCSWSRRDRAPASAIRPSSVSASAPTKSPALNAWKSKIVGRRGGPEPERVDGLAAVAHDRAIERDADQARRPAGDRAAGCRRAPRTSSRA